MKLNAAKTQALVLGTPAMLRGLPLVSLNFLGTVVPDSRVVKNLGVIIDCHLNFQSHVDQVTAKCTGILVGLIHAKHVIPKSVLITSCKLSSHLSFDIVSHCTVHVTQCSYTEYRNC